MLASRNHVIIVPICACYSVTSAIVVEITVFTTQTFLVLCTLLLVCQSLQGFVSADIGAVPLNCTGLDAALDYHFGFLSCTD